MDAIDNIMTRHSVREFKDTPVEPEKIDLILKAGFAAPTAVNKQPWHFVVVDDMKLRFTLASDLPYCKMIAQSPIAIVVCGDEKKFYKDPDEDLYWVNDTSAATENILLAAHALGLGAVWTAVYPEVSRIRVVRETLNLPDNLIPLAVIPLGYPAKTGKVIDKYDSGAVSYNRFE